MGPGMISVKSCRRKIAIFEESVSIPMYYHGIILGNRYWKSPPQIYTILFSHLLPWDNTWEAISDILGKYMGKDNRDDTKTFSQTVTDFFLSIISS